MTARVLIVDDDPVQRRLLDNMVRRFGHEPVVAESGDQAARLIASGGRFDCVVLDLVMPDLDGLGVLAHLRETGNPVPVIVQTAHGGIDNVVSAMRAGAVDFVVKPVGAERMQVSLRNALDKSALEGELNRMKRSQSGTLTLKDIVTRSPRMQHVLRTAEKAAASAIAVLIEGESGVGKELIARAIHGQGERQSKPFVAVNCGAIPDNLVESILFGHEKEPSPGRPSVTPASLSRPRAARCSSTRSASCRRPPRSSCCAPSRKAKSNRSARASPSRSTCG
jgi:DNA-binding NtrC family response regulator